MMKHCNEESKKIGLSFKARLKAKRNHKSKSSLNTFPNGSFKGYFTGLSVEIFEKDAILEIYRNGCYGKGSHSRGAPEAAEESLVLQLEEAFFLAYFLDVLQIEDLNGTCLDYHQLHQVALQLNPRFVETLAAYLYLKSKNWVVKSGSKFGGDYIIYKNGPDFFHASFVVYVLRPDETEIWKHKNLKGVQRVAETSNKDVLLLEMSIPEGFKLNTLEDFHQIYAAEIIVRRLKMSAFVQHPNVNK